MRTAVLALFTVWAGLAQTAPTFEAADVHVSPAGATPGLALLPNARVEFRAATLLQLISQAYIVPTDRIEGGPPWLDTDRFDITAQGPAHASQLALRTMLQPLLAERFGLVVERKEKDLPAHVFTVAKPDVIKAHELNGEPECKRNAEENSATAVCRNVSIGYFVQWISNAAPGYFGVLPAAVDRTNLSGAFDFSFRYTGKGNLTSENSSLSLFNAVEKATGIRIERGTAKLQVVSIVKVNRTPSPNPPGAAEKLGPPPTEFEVVDIRPSAPGTQEDAKIDNGRIDARGLVLRDLIAFAYNVEENWVRGEKWIETERFDIKAKSALTESDDTFRVMVQNLLADRFHLKVHKEPQPVDVYALTAGKPKLKAADPSARSTCKIGNVDGMRSIDCQNTTMAQLAERLREAAGVYIGHPVVDQTGLTGAWDFAASWTPFARFARRSPDDTTVVITVFEALDRQLGLKLAIQKHPMQVVVIDHIDRKPTEN
jgi:uncharacterized protein (TIGR03435 family)